jgi:hypothetical protein
MNTLEDRLQIVCFLLGNSTASESYMPTFRNTVSVPSSQEGRYEVGVGLRNVELFVWEEVRLENSLLKLSHTSYLLAYEDGTDRMFRNVGICN